MSETEVQVVNRSVYPDQIRESIELIPQEYLLMSEEELRKRVRPTLQFYELKQSFWDEVIKAQEKGTRVTMLGICKKICSFPYFKRNVLNDPLKLAWITAPLVIYENRAKAVLYKLTERYEELASMEITTVKRYKEDGEWKERVETCPKKANVLLQVIKNMEERIKGVAVQRQVTVHAGNPPSAPEDSVTLNMDAVNEKLKEIESKLIDTGANDGQEDKIRSGDEEIN